MATEASYLDDEWPADRTAADWLQKFRSDQSSILHALRTWQAEAIRIYWNLVDAQETKTPSFLTDKRYGVGSEFFRLTKIIMLWCDAELEIDPSPISRYARYVKDRIPYKNPGPGRSIVAQWNRGTKSKTEALAQRALDCWQRAYTVTEARAPGQRNDDSMTWKPGSGWGFAPGKAAFNGKELSISGRPANILRMFTETKRPIDLDALRPLWNDELVSDEAIRKAITDTRNAVRAGLKKPKSFDPFPRVSRGNGQTAWELAEELRYASVTKM